MNRMMSKFKSLGTRRVPQPSAGARRRGAKRPELLILIVQYGTVQYSTVQYCTVHYNTVQYSKPSRSAGITDFYTILYSTVQYSTVQYITIEYSTVNLRGQGHDLITEWVFISVDYNIRCQSCSLQFATTS